MFSEFSSVLEKVIAGAIVVAKECIGVEKFEGLPLELRERVVMKVVADMLGENEGLRKMVGNEIYGG